MSRGRKTGRLASQTERELAQRYLDLHRLAEESPDGEYCVNAKAEYKEHAYVYADTILVQAMRSFAKHGTFEFDFKDIRDAILLSGYERLIDAGNKRADALGLLADQEGCEVRSIERRLKKQLSIRQSVTRPVVTRGP